MQRVSVAKNFYFLLSHYVYIPLQVWPTFLLLTDLYLPFPPILPYFSEFELILSENIPLFSFFPYPLQTFVDNGPFQILSSSCRLLDHFKPFYRLCVFKTFLRKIINSLEVSIFWCHCGQWNDPIYFVLLKNVMVFKLIVFDSMFG